VLTQRNLSHHDDILVFFALGGPVCQREIHIVYYRIRVDVQDPLIPLIKALEDPVIFEKVDVDISKGPRVDESVAVAPALRILLMSLDARAQEPGILLSNIQ
jgi:hypothetical protein